MLRLVKTSPRLVAFVSGLALLALLAAGCSGSKTGEGGRSGGPSKASETPTAVFTGPPGSVVYRYANAGLVATLVLEGQGGTLEIDNGTGRELPKPGFYILDARDGHRIDGSVEDAAPVPDGDKKEFAVSFTRIEDKNIGLVVLLMGPDNYGGFVKQ